MNTLFLLALVIEALFGAGLVLVPGFIAGVFGVTLDAAPATFVRLFGSALLSLAAMLWLAYKSASPQLKKAVAISLLAYYLVSANLLVIAQLGSLLNAKGWALIVVHVMLMSWFGTYLVWKNPHERSA
jgi:hypothetical protein